MNCKVQEKFINVAVSHHAAASVAAFPLFGSTRVTTFRSNCSLVGPGPTIPSVPFRSAFFFLKMYGLGFQSS